MAEFVFVGPFVVNKGDPPYIPGQVTMLGELSWVGPAADPYAIQPSVGQGGVQSGVNYVPVFPQFEAWPAYAQKILLHANVDPIVDATGRPWIENTPAWDYLDEARKKFGAASLYFGDTIDQKFIYSELSADFSLGTSDFCFECWVWTEGAELIVFQYGLMNEAPDGEGGSQNARSGFRLRLDPNDAVLEFQIMVGGLVDAFSRYQFITMDSGYNKNWMWTEALPLVGPIHDQWVHYAVVRYGNVFQVYQNGLIVPTNYFADGGYVGGNTAAITMPNITANGTISEPGVFRIPQPMFF